MKKLMVLSFVNYQIYIIRIMQKKNEQKGILARLNFQNETKLNISLNTVCKQKILYQIFI